VGGLPEGLRMRRGGRHIIMVRGKGRDEEGFPTKSEKIQRKARLRGSKSPSPESFPQSEGEEEDQGLEGDWSP